MNDYVIEGDLDTKVQSLPKTKSIVRVRVPAPVAEINASTSKLRYVTVVLPSVVNPKGRKRRLDAITETWGPSSHAIYITHPNTDSEYSILPLKTTTVTSFPRIMSVPTNIATEEEGVPRLKYVIQEIYQKYDPEFAFFANDHTFIIPENLCLYLNTLNAKPDEHLYAGHALRPKGQKGLQYAFNSGASGYFLSRKTMQTLTQKWNEGDAICEGNGRKWLQGNPGLLTAECLKSMDVDPLDTRDEEKRHVFHAFGLVRLVKNEVDAWYQGKHEELNGILGEDEMYHHELQKGVACCSPNTASFHYVEYAETRALWETLDEVRRRPDIGDDALQQFMMKRWPTEKKDVGGYAHNLPSVPKQDVWKDLLFVVKSIAARSEEAVQC